MKAPPLKCINHEYTLSNLKFAATIEPNNTDITNHFEACAKLRQANKPTLPSDLALEKQINPFLRTHLPTVQQAVQNAQTQSQPHEVFSLLRSMKDNF